MNSTDIKQEHKKKYIPIIIIILIILVLAIILGVEIGLDKFKNIRAEKSTISEDNVENMPTNDNKNEENNKKNIKIFNGTDRPIAVMIDNHKGAWPQAGLNSAYLVYEIIVEGGETRLMALFKGTNVEKIGPVRSSRHYFLDYAIENDAIYAHYGWSPKAKSDITTLGVNNLNGIYYNSSIFWRISAKKTPHNVLTSSKALLKAAKDKGYRITSNDTSVLNYTSTEINLEDGISATNITIPYSYIQTVTYKYDKEKNRYTRYARGVLQKDYSTGESFTTKNIIIEFVENSTLNDGTTKDRQTLSNLGTFDGYYITNGKAIKIKCTKNSRRDKTIYKDKNENEIEVNDGNTWINICPKKADVNIK